MPVTAPHWDWDRWRVGGKGWVRPLANPALGDFAVVAGGRLTVCVYERGAPPPPPSPCLAADVDWWLKLIRDSPWDWTVLQVDRTGVRVEAGALGTAPVYLAQDGTLLFGCWDITRLRRLCHIDRLADRAVARLLTRRLRYSAETVFDGVLRLTERAVATFDGRRIGLRYPKPAPHPQPRELRVGVDVFRALDSVLGQAVTRRAVPDEIAVELSGGVDSAVVARAVHQARGDVISLGLVMPGSVGSAQIVRRLRYARAYGLRDVALTAADHRPFLPGGRRESPHDPASSYYLEAFSALAARARRYGVRLVYTGAGGDELLSCVAGGALRAMESAPVPGWLGWRTVQAMHGVEEGIAPVARLPLPTLMGFAARNPIYLAEGIWPVSPLVDPRVLRLGEQLPVGWREGKVLFRQQLAQEGFPGQVVDPAVPEVFTPLMESAMRMHGLPLARRMLAGSILIDGGFVDGDGWTQALDAADRSGEWPDLLADAVVLEVGLRSMEGGEGAFC